MNAEVIFYTTGCPKCAVLKKKLDQKRVFYRMVSDMDEMLALGIKSAPFLSVDGELMDYSAAVQWVNGLKEEKE